MSGLARGRGIEVRTLRGPHGTGDPVLCTDGRIRAVLPALRPHETVGAFSVNGPYVAWSVLRRAHRGIVRVARVQRAQLHAVRSSTVRTGTAGGLGDGMMVVEPDGTVAWVSSVHRSARTAVGAVWRRGRHATPLPTTPASGIAVAGPALHGETAATLTLLDDRHLLLGYSAVVRAFRPPVAGTCPRLYVGRWVDLAGWRIADVGGFTNGVRDGEFDSSDHSVVCDPASGSYLDVATAESHSIKTDAARVTFGTVARNGPLLIRQREAIGDAASDVTITNTITGVRHVVYGELIADGAGHSPEVLPGLTPVDVGQLTGAVAAPGATAWYETSYDTSERIAIGRVWLADAAGTRVAGKVVFHETDTGVYRRGIVGLAIHDGQLTWQTADGPRSVAVRPLSGEPYGVITSPAL